MGIEYREDILLRYATGIPCRESRCWVATFRPSLSDFLSTLLTMSSTSRRVYNLASYYEVGL